MTLCVCCMCASVPSPNNKKMQPDGEEILGSEETNAVKNLEWWTGSNSTRCSESACERVRQRLVSYYAVLETKQLPYGASGSIKLVRDCSA